MSGPVIAEIGEIRVTSSTVWTPAGGFPLRGSEWTVSEQRFTEQRRPAWALVLAIALVCVTASVSLLFLRVRRTVSRAALVVSVRNGPHRYDTRVPVTDQAQAHAIHRQVHYARSLAAL
jgi:hypothetical protein